MTAFRYLLNGQSETEFFECFCPQKFYSKKLHFFHQARQLFKYPKNFAEKNGGFLRIKRQLSKTLKFFAKICNEKKARNFAIKSLPKYI